MSLYDHYSEKELEILQARARRVERAAGEGSTDEIEEALLVVMRGETYALPIDSVVAVYENVPITPLPCTPPFIAGLVNLRGHLVTVLNLSAVLDIPGADESQSATNSIVVVTGDGNNNALLVQKVSEVSRLDTRDQMTASALLSGQRAAYVAGVLPDGTAILDMKALINDSALIVDQAAY